MKIRHATPDDAFDCLILAREFVREAPKEYTWNKDKVEHWLNVAIDTPEMCLLVCVDDNEEIQGAILGALTELFMTGDKLATEFAWFMSKEYRGTKHSLRLLEAFEEWAKENYCKYVVMADLTELQDLSKLYKRRGYKLTECSYIKELT